MPVLDTNEQAMSTQPAKVDEASQGLTSTSAPDPSITNNGRENIKVVVRIRPLLVHETGLAAVLAGGDNVVRVNGATANRQLQCRYDAVIGPEVSQEGMFSHIRECTSAVLDGENSTVFAYGQTGSGKTYTMFGPDLDANGEATPGCGKGIIPLAVADLFKGLVRRAMRYSTMHPCTTIYAQALFLCFSAAVLCTVYFCIIRTVQCLIYIIM